MQKRKQRPEEREGTVTQLGLEPRQPDSWAGASDVKCTQEGQGSSWLSAVCGHWRQPAECVLCGTWQTGITGLSDHPQRRVGLSQTQEFRMAVLVRAGCYREWPLEGFLQSFGTRRKKHDIQPAVRAVSMSTFFLVHFFLNVSIHVTALSGSSCMPGVT